MTCTHIGSIMCFYKGIEKAIDWVAAEPNRYVIHLGDWIEAICTDDKRYNAPPDGKRDMEQPIPLQQAQDVVEIFRPIKDRFITGLRGNHERKLAKFGDLVRSVICRDLNMPFGTESCRIVISDMDGKHMYNAYAMHGGKVFKSNAKDYEQSEANKKAALKLYLQNKMGNAAVLFCGHAHWIGIVPPARRLFLLDAPNAMKQGYLKAKQGNGYIHPDERWFACCGSARLSRLDNYDDYAQDYDPVELGFVKMVVEDGQIVTLEPFLI
jgi:predicted phosphodiesterase